MLVRITPELQRKLDELNIERAKKIADAKKIRDVKNKEASEMISKAREIQEEAFKEYITACNKLNDEYNKQYNTVITEHITNQSKTVKDERDKKPASAERVETGFPFLDLMLAVMGVTTEDLAKYTEECKDDNKECTCGGECGGECACGKHDKKEESKEMSLDEKLNFIKDSLNNLSEFAKAYHGLYGARVIKVRNNHECSNCKEHITSGDYAVVTYELKNHTTGNTFADFWNEEYDISLTDTKYIARTDDYVYELTAYRNWIDLDCAIAKIKEAFEFKM